VTADPDIALCLLAFQKRLPDARERADGLRLKLMEQMTALHRQARVKPSAQLAAQVEETASRLRALNDLLKQYGKKQLKADGPTAELLDQIRRGRKSDPVLRLYADGKLDETQVDHAREIAAIIYHVTKGMDAKVTYFPIAAEGGMDGETRRLSETEQKEWLAWVYGFVYLPWQDRVADRDLLVDLCVEGLSLSDLADKYAARRSTILRRIRDALDRYGEIRGQVLRVNPETPDESPVRRVAAPG
jgi:hypothetical protein